MFKKFGFKEILYGVRKYAIFVLIITILFGAVGYGTGAPSTVSEPDESNSTNFSFVATRSYHIVTEQSNNDKTVNETVYNVAESLKADFAKQYVMEHLSADFTPQQITSALEMPNTQRLMYSMLNDVIKVNVLNNTTIVNFVIVTKDEKVSARITELVEEYLVSDLSTKIDNIKEVVLLGEVNYPLNETTNNIITKTGTSPKKKMIVFAAAGFVLSMLLVLLAVLMSPAVARKSDYEEYGVKVIFDRALHRSNINKYGSVAVCEGIEDSKNIVVVSSINSCCISRAKAAFVKELEESQTIKENGITLSVSSHILNNFDDFEKARNSDGVILIERKGVSRHSSFDNTVTLLKNSGINIIGVCLI